MKYQTIDYFSISQDDYVSIFKDISKEGFLIVNSFYDNMTEQDLNISTNKLYMFIKENGFNFLPVILKLNDSTKSLFVVNFIIFPYKRSLPLFSKEEFFSFWRNQNTKFNITIFTKVEQQINPIKSLIDHNKKDIHNYVLQDVYVLKMPKTKKEKYIRYGEIFVDYLSENNKKIVNSYNIY